MISLHNYGNNTRFNCMKMKLMKTHDFRKCMYLMIIINLIAIIYFAVFQHRYVDILNVKVKERTKYRQKTIHDIPIEDEVTIIIREFEDFENKMPEVVYNFKKISEHLSIVIIGDDIPYPPINLNFNNTITFVSLKRSPALQEPMKIIESRISTPFVVIVPDAVELLSIGDLADMVHDFKTRRTRFTKILATPIGKNNIYCQGMDVDVKSWTLYINNFDGSEGMCDSIGNDHAILMATNNLFELSCPFCTPLHISLYMQFILRHWKTSIYSKQVFIKGKLFSSYKNEWKHKYNEEQRLKITMEMFDIKQIVYDNTKRDYFGCTKDTGRCFDSIIDDMPDFLHRGKWTPPCCLKAIRETARHVFHVLSKAKVRYWLEGGSLLGAVRHKDIIPWDYDVDIGIYQDDIINCDHLVKLNKNQKFIDDEGFQWEKAIEGNFFRVQYSDINRNHVDIFPFYSKSGTMTKDTWFKTHRQDTEFPEHYLQPLTFIEFIGMNVSVPNNYRKFLEFKFGNGVIENPKYPAESKQVFWN